jgi:superfamily II DNA/RNA helicase
VLVGTDVAARGLHVVGVDCVVHFDPPEDEDTYVHRSGRTGRAGASGLVVSLVTADQERVARQLEEHLGIGGLFRPAPSAVDVSLDRQSTWARPVRPGRPPVGLERARAATHRDTHPAAAPTSPKPRRRRAQQRTAGLSAGSSRRGPNK